MRPPISSSLIALASLSAATPVLVTRQNDTTPAAGNKLIPVVVGGPQDTFVPNLLSAAVGDVVQFQFSNGNHTVTQSAQDAPCTPLDGGIHSGHIPFQDEQTTVGTFNMPVTSTDPMFLYCATGPHCQEGQVIVINPTDAQQVLDYTKASQSTEKSTDGTSVNGGTVAEIQLTSAAFVPAPAKDAAAGGAGVPPAATAAASTSSTFSAQAIQPSSITNVTG